MTPTLTPATTIEPPYTDTIGPSQPSSATALPLAPIRSRRLTVGYLPAVWPAYTPRPDPLPYLRLRGHWLQDAGFVVGAKLRVRVESQRLILEVIDEERRDTSMSPRRVHESDPPQIDMGTHIV